MRRPAVGVGLAFAAGVGASLAFPDAAEYKTVWLACGVIILLLTILLLAVGQQRCASIGVFLVVAIMGLLIAVRSSARSGIDDVVAITQSRFPDCTVMGVVKREADETPGKALPNRTYFDLRADALVLDGVTNTVTESLYITMFGKPSPPPRFGERWRLTGNLYRHVWRGHVQWRFFVGLRETTRFGPPSPSLSVIAQEVRRKASIILTHDIEGMPDVCGVLQALLLGYRTRLDSTIKQTFARTGTMHIFAISGLHVAILCSVLVFVIGLAGVSRTGWFFLLAPIIILYAIATGSRASAVRAGVMASAYLLGPALRRRPDGISALALAGIGILVWQPAQLLEIGFIFSFAAVAGILTLVPVLDTLLLGWLKPDPLAAYGLTKTVSWWNPVALWMGRLAAVSLAAWLTTMPLSLYYFGRLAPIALVANLLVVPLAFLIIVTGCLSLVSGAVVGLWLAGVFNSANAVFVRLLIGGMKWLERVPYGYFERLEISRLLIGLWYGLLIYGALLLRDHASRQQAIRVANAGHARPPRSNGRNA